jgi:hypothetical protein
VEDPFCYVVVDLRFARLKVVAEALIATLGVEGRYFSIPEFW